MTGRDDLPRKDAGPRGEQVARDAAPSGPSVSIDPADRPGASGHRFGPDLACSECGVAWDAHQREPIPCRSAATVDAFARRPAAGHEDT